MPALEDRLTRLKRGAGFLILALLLLTVLPLPVAAAPSDAPAAAELPPGCFETIANGGFEQLNIAWTIPPSLYPGVYDNTLAFAGNFSMLLGRIDGPVYAADSTVQQTIALPASSTSIILTFRYYGRIDGTADTADRQYLDLYDANTNSFIRRQFEARNGDRLWLGAQYSLTDLRGRSVQLVFGTNNDGVNGRIAMNVDQVSLYYCSPQPTATPTPTPSVTPTFMPTFMPTVFPTSMPTFIPPGTPTFTPIPGVPGGCTSLVVNGGFETGAAWEFGRSPIPGKFVTSPVQEGALAAQLGNPPGYCPDSLSFSSVRQLVTIPPNATTAELRWFALLGTQEQPSNAILPGADRQELILLNPDLSTLAVLNRQRTNTGGYVQQVADLTPFRGRSVYIYFNALNDGNNLTTWMYVDNVSLCVSANGAQPIQPYVAMQPAQGYASPQPYASPQAYSTAQGYASPQPTYFVPTITPTPTNYPDAAPLEATQEVDPLIQPGEPTPDSAPVSDAQQFSQPGGATPDATLQFIAATTPQDTGSGTTGRTFNTLAGMCGVVIVAVLLFGGILYVISRPKSPPPGPPQQMA